MFHKGDIVVPVRPESYDERKRHPVWTDEMDKFNGVAGTVYDVDGVIGVSFEGCRSYYYKPEWLLKADAFHDSDELDNLFSELG